MAQYDAIRHEMMVEYLRGQQERMMWSLEEPDEGVVLRRVRGEYVCCPPDLAKEPFGLFKAVQEMNVRVSHRVEYQHYLIKRTGADFNAA